MRFSSRLLYLRQNEGFRDEQILAKGQCAGGPPTSELGKLRPKINVWIDQAPSGYHHMVDSLYSVYLNQGIEQLERKNTLPNRAIATVGRSIANSTSIPSLVAKTLPDFDVPANLRANSGQKLFTIGVPTMEEKGGDKFVPQNQQDAVIDALIDTKGFYVPMPGAEHVTDWWLVPLAKEPVEKFMRDAHISEPLIDPSWAGATPVLQNCAILFGGPYSPNTATRAQKLIRNMLQQVSIRWTEADLPHIRKKLDAMVAMTGLESKAPILKAMVEVAKAANKPYLALQLELDLMSSGGNVSKELLDAPLMTQDF